MHAPAGAGSQDPAGRLLARLAPLSIALLLLAAIADGQAYCALRDPGRSLRRMYPDAASHRSIVGTIDQAARERVGARLPFTLHFNELGRQTLYVTLDDDALPLGLVHSRSEPGRFGLVEVAWSFDLDLRVREFELQRCRERGRDEVEGSAFRRLLVDRGPAELLSLLTADGETLRPECRGRFSSDGVRLAAVVVRSALKALIVTEVAWEAEIDELRAQLRAHAAFAGMRRVLAVDRLYDPGFELALSAEGLTAEATGVRRERARAWRVLGRDDEPLGLLLLLPWRGPDAEQTVWITIGPDGRITTIAPQPAWVSPEIEGAFRELHGVGLAASADCLTAAGLAVHEMLSVAERVTGA